MPLNYELSASYDAGPHVYRVLTLAADPEWLNYCAGEYVRLRTQCAIPLNTVSLDGIDVLSTVQIAARLAAATIPIRRGGNFDVVRSDFGEVLAYIVLAKEFGTQFGYQAVRDRETIQLPARGIDVVGVEDGEPLVLVIGEVKVSDAAESPPAVVDAADDCLRNQHLAHLGDLELTADKIWNQSRFALDPTVRELLFKAAYFLEEERLDDLHIVSYSLLVRPTDRHTQADFGTFRSAPEDYSPSRVRFVVALIPDRVEPVVTGWHAAAIDLGLPE